MMLKKAFKWFFIEQGNKISFILNLLIIIATYIHGQYLFSVLWSFVCGMSFAVILKEFGQSIREKSNANN